MSAIGGGRSTGAGRGLGRPFAAQLASTGLANLGDGILGTLAPLLALSLTGSPLLISLLSAATWLPWLLFGIAAGVVIDRVDRRRAQVVALSARAAVLGLGGWLGASGGLTMTWLVLLVLAYGVTEVFADLGATSIVPDLVPADRLSAANGRVVGVQQVANSFLGAPLAGALVVLGAGVGFGTSAALAALAALVLAVGLRGRFRKDRGLLQDGRRGPLGEVREGLEFLFRHPALRPLVIAGSVLNFAFTGYFAVFVLWVVGPGSALGLTESQYPLLMLGFAAGAVLGSVLVEAVQRRVGELVTVNVSLFGSAALLLLPVVWPNPWVVGATLTVVGVVNTLGNVVTQSWRQRLVPGPLLGRVGGASRALGFGLMPLGALTGGLVAEQFGLAVTFVGAVLVCLLACGYLARALGNGADLPLSTADAEALA
ncbi:MAG: MFS transporter [Propionicimonas sp.]|uniref:MFS transporter n=1 Tax=Propionicimonas sp. TaxID=1955623 RepID=UPI003D12C76D